MGAKKAGQTLLMIGQPRRRGKEGGGEVQMEASINRVLAGQLCGASGVLHEGHGADRGDRTMMHAIEGAIGVIGVAAPIVCVDDDGRAGPLVIGLADLPLQ